MERVNLLNPFSSLPPHHENRLTWAFLVALKYDPNLQSFLRELVESRLPPGAREYCNSWESARVSTQTKGIESTTGWLVSVLLTDEAVEHMEVGWSDRGAAVYDGVVEYPNGLTLIIENKPSHGDVWQKQLSLSPSSYSGDIDDVTLHTSAICLEWPEILEGMLKYVESDMANFSGREISRDLLKYVEESHPGLTPYRTFELCGGRPQALRRRAIQLLNNLAEEVDLESRDNEYLFRPGKIAERIFVQIKSNAEPALNVRLYPADTVSQARRFYDMADRREFLSLDKYKWAVRPHLHFSFARSHLIWAGTEWEPDRFFDYFSADNPHYGQMNRRDLVPLANEWEKEGLIHREDRRKIEYQFTKKKTLNVIPGFSVSREWSLDEAINLENSKKLEAEIIKAVGISLNSWGETLVNN